MRRYLSNIASECQACGYSESGWAKLKYTLSEYGVAQCKRCGFIFVVDRGDKERLTEIFSSVSYHLKSEKRLRSLAAKQMGGMLKWITNPKGLRCLDVGCGNGYFLELACGAGMEVKGVEIDSIAARFVQERLGIKVYPICAEMIGQSLKGEVFDLVTLWGVIEHLRNPSAAIQSIKQVMRAGALLAIQTPSENGLIRKVIHLYAKLSGIQTLIPELYNREHVQCFSRKSITFFLSRHGFTILKIWSSSYGLKPLLERPSLRGWGIGPVLKWLAVVLIYTLGLLTGRGNHMTIYAKLSDH